MEEITYQKSYQEFKGELDTELQKTAEGFVRIGYLLKVARDTDVLKDSPYKTVTEFAEAEYGLSATYVSRFISINDRFAEDGYSDKLDTKYQGFGYAKLTVMLQLPDSMNEELSPDMSKSDIEAVKAEFDAESKVTDIERVIEGSNPLEGDTSDLDDHTQLLYQTILALGENEPELYERVAAVDGYEEEKEILEALPLIMVPSDTKVYSIRVIGKGRMMLTCTEDKASIVNSRTGEKENYTWSEVTAAWEYAGAIEKLPFPNTPIGKWEKRYEKKWPIAPVQEPKDEPEKPKKPKKESKVVKAKPDDEAEHIEEQVEGQMSFEEACPEIIPDNNNQENENESHDYENKNHEDDNSTDRETDNPSEAPVPDYVEEEPIEAHTEDTEVAAVENDPRKELQEDLKHYCNELVEASYWPVSEADRYRERSDELIDLILNARKDLLLINFNLKVDLEDEEDD